MSKALLVLCTRAYLRAIYMNILRDPKVPRFDSLRSYESKLSLAADPNSRPKNLNRLPACLPFFSVDQKKMEKLGEKIKRKEEEGLRKSRVSGLNS